MKITQIVQIVVLALIVFGLGAGLALWNRQKAPAPVQQQAAEAPKAATPAVTAAAVQPPTTEPGKIIPEAPEMPAIPAVSEKTASDKTAPAAAATAQAETPVAGMQAGGPFTLTDQKGNAVTEKSWPGKYTLVFFGFTSCPDTCPATLQKISAAMEKLDPQGAKIQPLFITTDPATDTQERMGIYMGGYPRILGLTGTKEQIEAAEKAYKVYVNGPDHSAYIYLMGPDGTMLDVLGADLPAEEMMTKIKAKAQL